MTVSRHDQAFSSLLDLCRWLAAWIVMWGHLRGNLFPDYKLIAAPSIGVKVFMFVTAGGQAAVMVFFVLSGFLVGGALCKAPATRDALVKYFIARFTRLYLVIIPAFALAAGLAAVRYWHSGGSDAVIVGAVYSPRTLLVNLAFLQVVLGPPYANNYPLWSLTNEFWYYATFPIVLGAARAWPSRWPLTVGGFAAATGTLLLLSTGIALYVFIWLLGVVAAVVAPRSWPTWPSMAAILVTAAASRYWFASGYFPMDFAVGASVAMLLVTARRQLFAPGWLVRLARLNAILAGCSFTLYVVHAPLLEAFIAFTIGPGARPELDVHQTRSWLLYGAVGTAILLIAFLIAQLTEARTHAVRTRVTRWVLASASAN